MPAREFRAPTGRGVAGPPGGVAAGASGSWPVHLEM
jgi:hypothetical protein